MKYKVGDKVRVKSQEWYNANKDKSGYVKFSFTSFVNGMCPFLGKCVVIESLKKHSYSLVEDDYGWDWTDEMFEGLVEPTIEELLIQLIKDNSNLDYREFCLSIESYLDSLIPCNYESEYIKESCNIDGDILLKNILELKKECQGLDFSHTLEKFVKTLSKREIAYLMLIKYYPTESDCAVW